MSQRVRIPSDEYVSIWHRVPSWAISLGLHAGLFLLMVSTMRGCGGSPTGTPGEKFRTFGVFVKDSSVSESESTPIEPEMTNDASQQVAEMTSVDEKPPSDLSMPSQALPTLGPGPAPLAPADMGTGEIRQEVAPAGALDPSVFGLGPGETAFADIRDSGDRFAYVIDRSGSMDQDKMFFARAHLESSLNILQPYQHFQILFYNETTTKLSIPREIKNGFYPANERNVRLAMRMVKSQQSAGGTMHINSLRKAIALRADVVFFLTDGHTPVPSVGEIASIRSANGGRSRIHCIEFGQGMETGGSWLQKVARQNGGQYKYVDVNRIRRQRSR